MLCHRSGSRTKMTHFLIPMSNIKGKPNNSLGIWVAVDLFSLLLYEPMHFNLYCVAGMSPDCTTRYSIYVKANRVIVIESKLSLLRVVEGKEKLVPCFNLCINFPSIQFHLSPPHSSFTIQLPFLTRKNIA